MARGKYLYATGRIRSLENKLLSQNDVDRMVDAKDADAAFKVFNDLSYADELSEVEKSEDYAEALKHDLIQVKRVLKQIVPDKSMLDLLFAGYDFHNMKLFFKAKFLEKDLSEYESRLGNADIANLKDFIIKDVKTSVPDKYRNIVNDANKIFDKEKSGFIIDSYIDSKYFEFIKDIIRNLDSIYIKNLARLWIDIANVKIFLRGKKLGIDIEKVREYLTDGGKIMKSSLENYYPKDLKEAAVVCASGFEDKEVKDAIKEYIEGGELWRLERAFENYEIKQIGNAKFIAYGPEVVVAYYLAKKNAVKNIRLIFTGKLNMLPSSEIKERLRLLY